MTSKLLTKATAIFDRILDFFVFLAGVALSFMLLSICAEVVMRYFLNRPLVWVMEISEFGMLYVTFLGAAWLLRKGGHIRIDLFIKLLKPKNELLVNIVTFSLSAVACLVLVWYGGESVWYNYQSGSYMPTQLEPPKWIIVAIIPLGSFLLFIQFLRNIQEDFHKWRSSRGEDGVVKNP